MRLGQAQNIGCGFLFYFVVFMVIGNLSSHSWWPPDFFKTDNLLVKIVLGAIIVFAIFSVIYLLFARAIPDDAVCPHCNLNVKAYMLARGGVRMCPECRTLYHGNCWQQFGGCARRNEHVMFR